MGVILCLNAAAKISHRAQNIGSLASQWHALLTCRSPDTSQIRMSSSVGSFDVANMSGSLCIDYSESDLESLDFIATSTNTQLVSYSSSYQKRQALGKQIKSFSFFTVVHFPNWTKIDTKIILVQNFSCK